MLNDQFGGGNPWEAYLQAIESYKPRIEALGITDYYTTSTYKEVRRHREQGRLPGVKLLFPNIELRLDVAAKSGFVNLHLVASPDDPNHVEEIKRFLSRLHFGAHSHRYDCTEADLIRLGKVADASIKDDRKSLAYGATQFRVNFDGLRNAFKESAWARDNILIAVAGAKGDGTSGLQQVSDKLSVRRSKSSRTSSFAGSPAQREEQRGDSQDEGEVKHPQVRHDYP